MKIPKYVKTENKKSTLHISKRRNFSKEFKAEIRKYFELNKNKNTMYGGLWDENKAVLTETFIALSAFIRKQERFQINNISFVTKKLEKVEQTEPKVKRRESIIE